MWLFLQVKPLETSKPLMFLFVCETSQGFAGSKDFCLSLWIELQAAGSQWFQTKPGRNKQMNLCLCYHITLLLWVNEVYTACCSVCSLSCLTFWSFHLFYCFTVYEIQLGRYMMFKCGMLPFFTSKKSLSTLHTFCCWWSQM